MFRLGFVEWVVNLEEYVKFRSWHLAVAREVLLSGWLKYLLSIPHYPRPSNAGGHKYSTRNLEAKYHCHQNRK